MKIIAERVLQVIFYAGLAVLYVHYFILFALNPQ